jgi:mRNA-degrading endonuclease RelE of RelBE toxin-antitoxin system
MNPDQLVRRNFLIVTPTYRIRIGNYRVIYEIHDEVILIEVVNVGHRKDVYRK